MTQQGFRYEPDLRHVVVVSEIGLESAKSVSTSWTDACESSSPLDAEHVKKDQSISARVHFPAQGRMDLRCAAKECGRKMSTPTVGNWLRGHMRCIIEQTFQQILEYLIKHSDAMWAFDTETRKSTSGGVITF